jgi:uncharacterized membrane protein
MIVISLSFIIFAFDVFGSTEGNIANEIFGFLLSILPGLLLLLSTIICWHKKRILSYLIGILSIVFFIFFGMYQIMDSFEIIFIIFMPMAALSALLFRESKN